MIELRSINLILHFMAIESSLDALQLTKAYLMTKRMGTMRPTSGNLAILVLQLLKRTGKRSDKCLTKESSLHEIIEIQ